MEIGGPGPAASAPSERSLDNGRYGVRLTDRGEGWSRFDRWAVTTGGLYPERDGGFRLYVRDLDDGTWWIAGWRRTTAGP